MGPLRLKPSPSLALQVSSIPRKSSSLRWHRKSLLVRSSGSNNQGSRKSPNLLSFKKVELNVPQLISSSEDTDKALFNSSNKGLISRAAEKLNFVARLKFKLDVSFDTNFHQPENMQRRTMSVLLVFTSIWLMGPVAAASFSSSDDTTAAAIFSSSDDTAAVLEIPEYGPQLPKKEEVFTGDVFLARVARPLQLLEDGAGISLPVANEDEEAEEVLELSLSVPRAEVTAFDCFINLPNASKSSPITLPEFVGSYNCEVDTRPGHKKVKVRFGISDKIRMFKLINQPSIVVAMVKHSKNAQPLIVHDIDVTLE